MKNPIQYGLGTQREPCQKQKRPITPRTNARMGTLGWTVTGPSPAEGYLPWPGVLLVGELAQVPHYPER